MAFDIASGFCCAASGLRVDQHRDDHDIEFAADRARVVRLTRFRRIGRRRAADAFGCQFVHPREHHRDHEADRKQDHHQAHGPVGDVEERKDLGRDLHQQPRRDRIRDRRATRVGA